MEEGLILFRNYSNILISGSTQSGKTQFTKKLLINAHKMFVTPPSHILYSYSHWQPAYDELCQQLGPNITFTPDIPDEEDIRQLTAGESMHAIYVADDKASEIGKNYFFTELLTRMGHYYKVSSILIVQDGCLPGKMKSVLTKIFHIDVLMRSGRDRNFLRTVGIMMNDFHCLVNAYDDTTSERFNCLIVDTHPL